MSFFAVLFALLIEQVRPLGPQNLVHEALVSWTRLAGRNFDAGRELHAWVVWGVSVAVPALLAGVAYVLIVRFGLLWGLAWNVAVLYVTLGFRQFSHHFTEIRESLERGDDATARRLLAEWRHLDASELPHTELLRHVIEHSLLAAHRHVFGVFFWFVVLAALGLGPAGAVMYRMAEFSGRYWAYKSRTTGVPSNERVMALSQRLFSRVDHVPARLTAFGFAVVGNFEEALAGWRRDAGLWKRANEGILLSAAAGAIGVRLGGGLAPGITPDRSRSFDSATEATESEGSTPGLAPNNAHLRSIVGLVWRSVVLWMLLLALLTVARLIG